MIHILLSERARHKNISSKTDKKQSVVLEVRVVLPLGELTEKEHMGL